jgi:chaperonin GroES
MQMVNIIPLGNRVLVRPLPKREKTTGGLIIPVSINKELEEAEVIKTGEAVINVKPGDVIIYQSRSGTPILIEDVTYKFLIGPSTTDTGEIIAIT